MRADCRHYESRTYPTGETVRKCQLDLAPEAPWKCPEDCPSFHRRIFDAGWQYGSFGAAAGAPQAPEPQGEDVAALLDAAEDIVNSAAPDILAEFEKQKSKKGPFRRKSGGGKGKGKGKRKK
jgi:hypothetical protein